MQFVMAVDILKTTSIDKLPNDLEGMEASMERLLALIDDIYKYVDNVVVSCVGLQLTIGFWGSMKNEMFLIKNNKTSIRVSNFVMNCLFFAYVITLSGRAR